MVPFGDSLRRLRDKVLMNEEERREEAIHTVPPLPPCPSSAVIAEPVPSSTSRSAFFQHLPAEVRQRILEAAFGDQTVHMHLSIERPLLRKYRHKNRNSLQSNSSSSSSNDKLQGHGWHPGRSAWDTAARPHWVWRSSVCHFGCFPHESWQCRAPEWSGWSIEKDFCVAGESCELPGSPGSCGVGATGWLLACRRAYREGMPVLYGTNTLRIRGTYMFAQLPALLPGPSLASLTTVSLYWDLGWLRQYPRRLTLGDHPEDYSFLEGLEELMQRLPETLSNVKRLHLSLQGFFWPEEQGAAYGRRSAAVYERTEELLRRRILAHVLRMPKMVDFRVALPRSLYLPWLQELMDVTLDFAEPAWAELPAVSVRRDVPPELSQGSERKSSMDSFLVLSGASDLPVLSPISCF